MNKYSCIIYVILVALLSGCTSINQISFDQLQPAVYSFPEQIKNVAIISTIPQVKIDNIDIINPEPFTGDQKKVKDMLAKNIADNGYFDKVVVCDSVINKGAVSNNLSADVISSLLNDFGADMIISLDRIDLLVKRIPGFPFGYNFDIIQCITTPEIKYYVPKKNPLFYTEKSDTTYYTMLELTDARSMLNEMCEKAISKSTDIILPHWRNISRYYITGGCYEMRDAEVAINENNWDEAYNLWKSVYENRKGKLKNAAALNIALFYEMKDDIPNASKWLDKASERIKENTDLYSIVEKYRFFISERENQIGKLKMQMNRFSLNN